MQHSPGDLQALIITCNSGYQVTSPQEYSLFNRINNLISQWNQQSLCNRWHFDKPGASSHSNYTKLFTHFQSLSCKILLLGRIQWPYIRYPPCKSKTYLRSKNVLICSCQTLVPLRKSKYGLHIATIIIYHNYQQTSIA